MGAMGLGGVEGAIETHGLRRVFKTRKQVVEAVAGVDLTVKSGEIFGFLGPNGAGKTTTLRMLATLLPPTGGTARVAGCDLAREPDKVRTLIGYVSQAGGSSWSGVLLPLSLAPQWLRNVAAANPLSYAVDAARAVFLAHLGDPSVVKGVVIMAVLCLIAIVIGARAFGRAVA